MATFTPAAAYWTAVLAASGDSARATAVADLLTTGTKLKFYDSGGTLIRTVETAAWTKGALTQNHYPITPGAFTGSQTGTGTPATVVVTASDDTEIFRTTAGVLENVFQIPSAFATGVDLTAGSFTLKYPSSQAAPSGKVWTPGHYLMVTDDYNRLGMLESSRNLVKTNSNWVGYYGHYWWHRCESTEGVYDFSIITDDLDKAAADGKKMWVMLNNRSFHGSARGSFCPAYIVNAGWTYAYTGGGENFAGPKLWVSGCGGAWLNFLDAALDAIAGHSAFQGMTTEENQMSGCWLQAGWTWQAHNEFLLEQSRRGAAKVQNGLWHNNMSWSNEPASDTTEHYRMTDTMVRVHRSGLAPNDLRLSGTGGPPTVTPYGSYCFTRYAGEAYFMAQVEWLTYFLPESPRQIIDYAVDTLGMNFIGWQPVASGYSGQTFSITDVIAEVNRQSGRINDTRPTNATA
ncbi:MAG: hypothetical protein J5J04_16850 [Anaerolineae bacterium]|nr:hypothetical protein [Anaerolineae bacterium]